MKNSGDRFRVKLHIVEERVNQHEGMKVETLQNKRLFLYHIESPEIVPEEVVE